MCTNAQRLQPSALPPLLLREPVLVCCVLLALSSAGPMLIIGPLLLPRLIVPMIGRTDSVLPVRAQDGHGEQRRCVRLCRHGPHLTRRAQVHPGPLQEGTVRICVRVVPTLQLVVF